MGSNNFLKNFEDKVEVKIWSNKFCRTNKLLAAMSKTSEPWTSGHSPLLDEAFLNALLEGEQRGKHDGRVVSLVQIRFFQRDDVVIVNVVYLAFRLHILTFYFFLLLTGFS